MTTKPPPDPAKPAGPLGKPSSSAQPGASSEDDSPLESLGKAIIAPVLDAGDNDPDAPVQQPPKPIDPGR